MPSKLHQLLGITIATLSIAHGETTPPTSRGELASDVCWPSRTGCPPAPEPDHCNATTDGYVSVPKRLFHKMVDWGLVGVSREILSDLCINSNSSTRQGALKCTMGTAANGRPLNLAYCDAKHVVLDFSKAVTGGYVMYQRWPDGGLQIDCDAMQSDTFEFSKQSCGFSWGSELADTVSLTTMYPPKDCDLHITEPTLLVKTDFPHHVYHHFTSLFNVWLSLHVADLPTDGSTRVIFVDKFMHRKTVSEPTNTWLGTFTEAWWPFTRHPILDHRHLGPGRSIGGSKLCIDRAILTYPPRASYFYPTRGVGCSPSNMMTSFVDWMLKNMSLVHLKPAEINPVVVTYVSRGGPKVNTRKILNEATLLNTLRSQFGSAVELREVDFSGMPFREQVATVRQSHVLAGMHGAGLTHLLWLPRHASRVALVEIFNTFDEFCYKDLAALSGVRYFTWSAPIELLHPNGAAELEPSTAKHVNYNPDVQAFVSLMTEAVEYVRGTSVPAAHGEL